MRKRIRYSQNFLKNRDLVRHLLERSSINSDDVVYEIGAGEGIITQALSTTCKKVIAYEIDENLSYKLKQRFENHRAEIRSQDFLKSSLPDYEYKVFSNIPFNLTAEIIKKLAFSANPPIDSYLIVQKEAAKKFLGKRLNANNSLISVLMQANFEMSLFYEFNRNDFIPRPMVDIVMIKSQKRDNPLIKRESLNDFYDFITFAFSQFAPDISKGLKKTLNPQIIASIAKQDNFSTSAKPSEVPLEGWVELFSEYMRHGNKNAVHGAYKRLLAEQSKLEKVNRTRVDKNWKSKRYEKQIG